MESLDGTGLPELVTVIIKCYLTRLVSPQTAVFILTNDCKRGGALLQSLALKLDKSEGFQFEFDFGIGACVVVN